MHFEDPLPRENRLISRALGSPAMERIVRVKRGCEHLKRKNDTRTVFALLYVSVPFASLSNSSNASSI